MGHAQPQPLEGGQLPPEKPENKVAQKASDNLQGDVAKQGFHGLNSHVTQALDQAKQDRNMPLDEQLQKNGTVKIGVITRQFGCSMELTEGDHTVVKGRSSEEVTTAIKQMKQASDKDMLMGSGGQFVPRSETSVLVAYGNDTASDATPGKVYNDAQTDQVPDIGWTPLEGNSKQLQIGNEKYDSDQVTAQDWGALVKKGLDRAVQSARNPELAERENPPEGGDQRFPHQGREDEFIDYDACTKANKAFPVLATYIGDGPGKVDPDLIAATIRNEQFYYKNVADTGPDHYIRAHGNWPFNQDESIGPAQMQVQNINHLAEQFPKILGTKTDAVKNAETVEHAPYFVGAYFADVIQGIESKQKPDYISNSTWKSVNDHWQKGERNEALILAYNPHAEQVNHVFTQIDNIKAPDWD